MASSRDAVLPPVPGAPGLSAGSAPSDDDYVDIRASPLLASGHLAETALRPIQLSTRVSQVRVPVPTAPYEAWITAIVVRDDFHRGLAAAGKDGAAEAAAPAPPAEEDDVDDDEETRAANQARRNAALAATQLEGRVVLAARFLGYLAGKLNGSASTAASGSGSSSGSSGRSASPAAKAGTPSHEGNILQCAWAAFNQQFLAAAHTDVHALTARLDAALRTEVLCSYYDALVVLEHSGGLVPALPTPKLLALAEQGETEIFAVFGGQGTNEVYFDELQELYNTYRALVAPTLQAASAVLQSLVEEATLAGFGSYYTHGADVFGWLSGRVPRPPVAYFASIPLSLPLIGLTQLTQYLVACRASGLSPGEFRARVKGATGHSQGVVSAIVLAASESEESFALNVIKGLRLLFHIGKRGQEGFPRLSLDAALVADAVAGGEGEPTPMLSVQGLTQKALDAAVAAVNKHNEAAHKIDISLFNGPTSFVVTGPPRSLFGLVGHLRAKRADPDADQSKLVYSKRKAVFNMRFLPVGVPYHSRHLEGAADKVVELDLQRDELWSAGELRTAVHNTYDGSNLATYDSASIVRSACDQIFTQHIHWLKACNVPASTTHCVDFGTGGLSGIGGLTLRNLEGRGVRVVTVSGRHRYSAELYDVASVQREQSWDAFAPKLARTANGLQLDTPLARILGRPPITVAGMTPSTVQAGFNAATANAGYHIELAGGGHYSASDLRRKIDTLQSLVQPGVGFTLNSLYINQRQFTVQFPEWLAMRREGYPLQGFTCAAGIPSPEKAKEIIDGLKTAGLRHMTLKPGSASGIKQVCAIAAQNPSFGIILCWTGGRAGGHHSSEDEDAPLAALYSRIRQQRNIALMVGGGFGEASGADFAPYLDGSWSAKHGLPPAPVDGVVYGSWAMLASDSHTSAAVRELMVAAPGCDDSNWEQTHAAKGNKSGIISVISELGERIHVIENRGTRLWRKLDDELFSLKTPAKRDEYLAKNKKVIVKALNADFAKVWFPAREGQPLDDLSEMTYREVALRLVELCFVAHQGRWIDPSYRQTVGEFLRRCEERAATRDGPSVLQSFAVLDKEPAAFVQRFFDEHYPARLGLLGGEDVAFLLALVTRRGAKPPPFIPALDGSFQTYFKKDSLWQSEDLDAVPGQDAQRVFILHGPVAAQHAKRSDQPIKDMLDGVQKGLIQHVLQQYYGGDESKVPYADYLGPQAPDVDEAGLLARCGISKQGDAAKATYSLGSVLPPADEWLEVLAGHGETWMRALLRSVSVVQGSSYADNPIARILSPRRGQVVEVSYDSNGAPLGLVVRGSARSYGPHKPEFKAVEISRADELINVTLFEDVEDRAVPLPLQFRYVPSQPFAPIHEVMSGRNERIADFYRGVWSLDAVPKDTTVFTSPPKEVEAEDIRAFSRAVSLANEEYVTAASAPLDWSIRAGWRSLMAAAMSVPDSSLLDLVHLSNSFKRVAAPLRPGDVCSSRAEVTSVKIGPTGKSVVVRGVVLRHENGEPVPAVEVTSSFFFRGSFKDYASTFTRSSETYRVELKSASDVSVLLAKEWFSATGTLTPGVPLEMQVDSEMRYAGDSSSFSAVGVSGGVYMRDANDGKRVRVGEIAYDAEGKSYGNPVVEYIKRLGGSTLGPIPLEGGGYSLLTGAEAHTWTAPATNAPYSAASGDYNPIHINPYFSDLAGLPGTITHGMHSSAAVRRIVEEIAAEGHADRFRSFDANFTGMVLPGDELTIGLRHVAMRDGRKIIRVEATNQRGDKVLDGEATVDQAPTVYTFTGQGSQAVGMGMDLYESSPVARAIWERAERHLQTTMGISVLDIVRNNPKSHTCHFGGVAGARIRNQFMSMTFEAPDGTTRPLFPEITTQSTSYTFNSPDGLLFMTSFAQVSIVLVEMSAFQDMQSRGMVDPAAPYAGHSLGEYAALASGGTLTVEQVCDVCMRRGLTMERAVARDAEGRTDYALMAVAPARLQLTDEMLMHIITEIDAIEGCFLQGINFNVSTLQTVVAGNLRGLQTLTHTLNAIAKATRG